MNDPQTPPSAPIDALIDAYIDDTLDGAGFATLCDWLAEDADHRRAFTRALALHSGIADWVNDQSGGLLMPELSEVHGDNAPAQHEGLTWVEALAALSDDDDEVHPVDLTDELARRERESSEKARHALRLAQPHPATAPPQPALSKLAVVLAFAATLGLIAWLGWPDATPTDPTDSADRIAQQLDLDVSRTPATAPNVAAIRGSVDARWVGMAYDHQHRLRMGKAVTLRDGLAEVIFDDGASVIIQGPATFEPIGPNAMRLDHGRIVATVPPAAIGFTVDTPSARIIDYGTVFGVYADTDASTQVHVIQGEVRAAARLDDITVGRAVSLTQRQAAAIDAGGASVVRVAYDAAAFEQRVAKHLDLVDIVAGGDGTGDAAGRGIDYRNGQVVEHAAMALRSEPAWIIESHVAPSRVRARPMIDSVFIVDRRSGSAVVDSRGTAFNRFPPTPEGVTFTDFFGYGFVQAIADGNAVMPVEDRGYIDQPFATVGRPELDGRAIILHGGGGITFDLHEVARQHAGLQPTRLTAHALSAEAVNQASKQTADPAHLDLWVLVDGEPRFEAQAINTADGVFDIDIELQPGDRFLTLVVSDAGDSISHDWLVLAQPTLEVGPPTGTD